MMGLCRQDHTLTSTAQIRKSLDLLFILQSHCKIWKMDMGAFIKSRCPFFQCFWLSLFNLILLIGLLKWMTRPNLGQRLCDLCPSSVTFSEISSQTFGRRFSWAEWFYSLRNVCWITFLLYRVCSERTVGRLNISMRQHVFMLFLFGVWLKNNFWNPSIFFPSEILRHCFPTLPAAWLMKSLIPVTRSFLCVWSIFSPPERDFQCLFFGVLKLNRVQREHLFLTYMMWLWMYKLNPLSMLSLNINLRFLWWPFSPVYLGQLEVLRVRGKATACIC